MQIYVETSQGLVQGRTEGRIGYVHRLVEGWSDFYGGSCEAFEYDGRRIEI